MTATPNPADLVRGFLLRYVVLSPEQATACALWVLHTWVFSASNTTPYLVVLSATKQSGKTRLLEVLELLVREPFRADSVTEAVLFRVVDQRQPTIVLDEMDATFGAGVERTENLRAALNSGNRAGGQVARCVPPAWVVKEFSVFCPKALAGIDNGRWPDTLLDRSVTVRLKRRAPDEAVSPFYYDEADEAAASVRQVLDAWSASALERLSAARPDLPDGLSDRAADAWRPLFAIADLLGDEWPEAARATAVTLFQQAEDLEDTPGVVLLADIRDVFSDSGEDRLASKSLAAKLRSLPDSRWASWGARRGQPGLQAGDLAFLLRPFGVQPRVLRLRNDSDRGATLRGYLLSDFTDAWRRYLPEERHDV